MANAISDLFFIYLYPLLIFKNEMKTAKYLLFLSSLETAVTTVLAKVEFCWEFVEMFYFPDKMLPSFLTTPPTCNAVRRLLVGPW